MKPYILIVRPRNDPSGKVVHKLLIDHEESQEYGPDGEVNEAIIRIFYRVIGVEGFRYEFSACYFRDYKKNSSICLSGPSLYRGAIFLDPCSLRGNRVGSFIMNKIVEWAINWPDANINQIELFALQGHDENKLRRNRFYEQFGIKFDYTDSTHTEGTARPMQARSLTPLKQLPKNLSVISLDEFLDEQEKCLSKTKNDLENQQKLNERLNSNISHAYDHIIWFAAKTIWEKHFKFLLGTIIFCAAIWHWW